MGKDQRISAAGLSAADGALLALLRRLEAEGYGFVTPTPLTHSRILKRPQMAQARNVRDVLGWSLPFARDLLDPELFALLEAGGALARDGELWRSTLRVSRLHGLLFLHSAYPTEAEDSVFLGPDSYRFADFIQGQLAGRSWLGQVVDVGGGAGVGAITAAKGRAVRELVLTDVNPNALRLARINAAHAGQPLIAVEAPDLDGAPEGCDLILANPPYIVVPKGRDYRHGGGMHGAEVSLAWARAALDKLAPGGRFLLYTGSAILEGGRDELRGALATLAAERGAALAYRELDPDVFGEELETPAYADVERIAVVGAVLTRPRAARG
jgi:methylase of polypeptide subunit release factors